MNRIEYVKMHKTRQTILLYSAILSTKYRRYLSECFLAIKANVRVYDQLRGQSDSVSRYTFATQSDTACDLMPSN
jgi:hypothetical protein